MKRRIQALLKRTSPNNQGQKAVFAAFLLLLVTSLPTLAGDAMDFTFYPPVAVTDNISTDEDTPVNGNALSNDFDPDGGPLQALAETKTSAHGVLVIKKDGTFTYTPNQNYYGTDSFTYSVTDNEGECTDGTIKITIRPIQDAPIGSPDSFTTPEDTPLSGSVLGNDTDPDGEPITAVLNKPTQHGTIILNPNGTFDYQPNPNFHGTDTFTYYANDGTEHSGETLVTITVTPVNDAPIAVNDAVTTDEDIPVNIPVLSNDTDVDDALVGSMITIVTQPTHGTAVINTTTGNVTYTPSLNYFGNDSFTYKIKDAAGAISNIGTVTITVNPVNDAPIAAPDFVTTPEDTPVGIPVLVNDTDVDNALNTGSITVVNGPSHGTIVVQPATGTFLYTPANNYYGTDSFTYTVRDVAGAVSLPGTVTITITPVNDKPIAVNDAISTDENIPVNIPVLSNDTDVEDALVVSMITIVTPPTHGTVVINATTGKVTYTPNPNYFGPDSFTYTIKDSGGAVSNIGTVTITVNPVNYAPVAAPDFATTPEDTPVIIPVLANDTDADNALNTGSIAIVSGPAHGSIIVQPSTGTFLYTPANNYYGTDSFTYTVKDVEGAVSLPGTVTITVTPVNDTPIAGNDAISTDENIPVTIPILSNDTDVEDALVVSMITIVTPPAHGSVVINPTTGKVTYTPNPNYFGPDSFTYTIKDSGGAVSNIGTVAITVNPVNFTPIAAPDFVTTPEDTPVSIPVLANDTDADNALNTGSIRVVTGPSHGAIVVQPSTGTFLYTPGNNYYGTDSFTYTVEDVEGAVSLPGTVTITITPVNDAPVAVGDAATTDENTPVGIPVLANDFDVDNAINITSVTITTNPQHGTVSINPSTGVVTYTPQQDYAGNDSFAYTIQDAAGMVSAPATVNITVININLPPVAVDDGPIEHGSVLPITIDVLNNDYDPDNDHDELSIVSVTNPSIGTVSIVNGEIVYQPEGTLSTTVTFTYTITDPDGLTDEAVVTITYIYTELLVSQGFSPNGDGNNDTWYIKGIEYYPGNTVKVFDRWGLLVYQKSGYENTIAPWDGRGNTGQMAGKLVERGTYFYVLEPGGGLKRLEGYVIVIR